ncbi:MAG: hypothetical protein V8R11_01820 [Alphaproteobacteria bacterium]|nr:hypothetical protein [Acetobacter sp.]
MEIPTTTFLTTAFLTTTFLTAVLGKTLSGAGSLLQSPADLQQLWLCVSKKNYADVSKKLLHNRFKLLD